MTINQKLTEPFPQQALKTRQGGGGKALTYVEGHTVIHRLIAATDNQWSFRVVSIDTRAVQTRNGEATLVMATVELEIPGLGARQHIGVQMVNDAGGEDLVKGAITDALKKAATLFGVGLELYGPDYESGEIESAPRLTPHPQSRQARDVRPHEPAVPAAARTASSDDIEGFRDEEPQRSPADILTPKQLGKIKALARDLGWEPEQGRQVIADMFGKGGTMELTLAEASKLIDHMIAQMPQEQQVLANV